MSTKGDIHSQIAIEKLHWYSKLILKDVNIDIIMASIYLLKVSNHQSLLYPTLYTLPDVTKPQ